MNRSNVSRVSSPVQGRGGSTLRKTQSATIRTGRVRRGTRQAASSVAGLSILNPSSLALILVLRRLNAVNRLLTYPGINVRPREPPAAADLECRDLFCCGKPINWSLRNLQVVRDFPNGQDSAFARSGRHGARYVMVKIAIIVQDFQPNAGRS